MSNSVEHDMKSSAADKHFAYLDSGNMLKVIVENRPMEEVCAATSARSTRRKFFPRWVFVDPAVYPGITTDQNSNTWVDGVEWKDITVCGELSDDLPPVIRKLAIAAEEAARANPIPANA